MYSPKIREDLVPYLYRLSRHQGTPMTKLVNGYLEQLIQKFKLTGIFTQIQQEEEVIADLTAHFTNLLKDRKKKTAEVIELLQKIA
jgi:hypothetical protein